MEYVEDRKHRTVYGDDVPNGQFTALFQGVKYFLAGQGPRIMTHNVILNGHARPNQRHQVMWDVVKELAYERLNAAYHRLALTPAHWCEMITSYMRDYSDHLSREILNDDELMHGIIKDKQLFYRIYVQSAWRKEFALRKGAVIKPQSTPNEWQEALPRTEAFTQFHRSSVSFWRVMDTVKPKEPTYIQDFEYFMPYFLGKLVATEEIHFKSHRVQFEKDARIIMKNLMGIKLSPENSLAGMYNYPTNVSFLLNNNNDFKTEFDRLMKEKYVIIEGLSNFSPYVIHAVNGTHTVYDYIERYVPNYRELSSSAIAQKLFERLPAAKKAYDDIKSKRYIRETELDFEKEGKKRIKLNMY